MKKTIEDYELEGKKVIIRVDFNVPIKNGKIQDDSRIQKSLPTINYAIKNQAKVILLSHLGRVKTEEDLAKNNLKIVAEHLSKIFNQPILFSSVTRGKELEDDVASLENGQVLLVQNTRYEDLEGKKESTNDKKLASYWASLGDIFINDAFATAHRAHASNVGIGALLPNGVGFLMEKELNYLKKLEDAKRPFVAILGGSKVSDKIGVIENLVLKCDKILIGGAMAFTFLKADGKEVGKSLVDSENLAFCERMLKIAREKIILPIDAHVSCEMTEASPSRIVDFLSIEQEEQAFDLGPETIKLYQEQLESANTIFWNGPLGVVEIEKYQVATEEILDYLTKLQKEVILGGGDIASAAKHLGFEEKVTYISTGGGATLEYLEGKELPGLKVITDK